MKERLKRISVQVAGWGFIFLGILGIFLPVLQGILFLLVGLYLLSSTSPWAAKLLLKLRLRFPKISGKFDEARTRAREVQINIFRKKERQPEE